MRDYELVVLFHPDLEIDLDKPLKKVEGLVKDQKGKIITSDNWGKRKLAYPISKQEHAIYVYYEISLPPEGVAGLESNLNITKEVIRYLVANPVPKVEEESEEDDKKSSKDDTTDKKAEKKDLKKAEEKDEEKDKPKADDAKEESEDKVDEPAEEAETSETEEDDKK